MTPERWQKAKDISHQVLDEDPSNRRDRLDLLCGDDEELRRDVELMIADASGDDDDQASFLRSPFEADAAHVARSDGAQAAMAWQPARVGRYRVIRPVGEGGMGVVYEAEQDAPRRTVALKIIRPGLATPAIVRRFTQEAHALGLLQHPGIAQIYEASSADSPFGPQPYFAMEFVRGETLRVYLDQRAPRLTERLELLTRICDAVDHAHQHGIIHRDLKPSNILIDASGQPKVLDFGVARLTDNDVQLTRQTDLGQLVGTLAYMSPEQVSGDPGQLDPRSDVYALGVMLYELLAGRLPYVVGPSVQEAIRTIQQEEPERLGSVSRTFRGDLETIAGKALEKDKSRRYESAAALSTDIRRHLHNEPITARPPTTLYQLQKFSRRHRAVVVGTVAVLLALVAGIVATTREALRARTAEQTARSAQQTTEAVNDFLRNDLLAYASAHAQAGPSVAPDPELKVRTALDRAAARIEGKFAAQPLVEAAIRHTIGRTYVDLGIYQEAQPHIERALALRRSALGDGAETVDTMYDLSNLLLQQGKYADAEPQLRTVVDVRRRLLGEQHADTLAAASALGLVYAAQGKLEPAEPLLASAVEGFRRIRGDDDPQTIDSMGNLGFVYDRLAKYREAEAMYGDALKISQRVRGHEHPETLLLMNNLAEVYRHRGSYSEAEPLMVKTLALRRRVLGDAHPHTHNTMNNLGIVYSAVGRLDDAERLLEEVLALRLRALGERHPNTLMTMNNLAHAYRTQGKYTDAETMLVKAIGLERQVQGVRHPDTRLLMSNLVLVYRAQGRYAEAKALIREGLESDLATTGPNHPDTLRDLERLALIHHSERQYAEAEEVLTKVVEGRQRVLGEGHLETLIALISRGRVRLDRENAVDAEGDFRLALDTFIKTGLEVWQRYSSESFLGTALAAQKKYSAAEPLLIAGHDGMVRFGAAMPASEAHQIEGARRALADLYRATGDQEREAQWRRRVPATFR